jgi:hypothetical protein
MLFVGSSRPIPRFATQSRIIGVAKLVAVRAAMAEGDLRIKRGKGFEGGGEGLRWAGPQGRAVNRRAPV